MLAYQPVRSLAGLNIAINQGLSAAKRVFPIIDRQSEIKDDVNLPDLMIKKANIEFKKVNFSYNEEEKLHLNLQTSRSKVARQLPGWIEWCRKIYNFKSHTKVL